MTAFTRDPDKINAEWKRITGRSDDWTAHVQRSEFFFVLIDGAGMLIFLSDNPRVVRASIYKDPQASGAEARDMINRGFRWVMLNTDAYVIRGTVAQDNAPMKQMARHIDAIMLDRKEANVNLYKITLASFAKHHGADAVIQELRQRGHDHKADRLQDAWANSSKRRP